MSGPTRLERRNVGLLATCQALMMTASTLIVATSALVGLMLADNAALATLPFGLMWLATTLTSVPAALLMRRYGRRAGLMGGVAVAIAGGSLCTLAIFERRFELFCAGSMLVGAFNAFGQQYRFAAADAAGEAFRARAISLVIAGGVVAAIAGPNLARATRELFPLDTFAGSYAAMIALYALSFAVLVFIDIPRSPRSSIATVRITAEAFVMLMKRRRFLVAAASAMLGYGVMNLVMTTTPLAMLDCGFGFDSTAFVIQWHVLAMFVPSFFTGHLIERFGALRIIMAGALLQLMCVLVNLQGVSQWNFVAALMLLGLGWNFLFVGGTSLLTTSYSGAEKATAQGLNDFLVFGTVTLTALGSGALHHAFGWGALNMVMVPFIVTAFCLGFWLNRRAGRNSRAAQPY
ncbi:MAG: MFS transporter [Gammaproteobacteria bacterium]|nr:MFS transporter [Gammaproteobacteria bacterium]